MKTLFTLPEANKGRQVGPGPLPPPVTAITMINRDQNTAARRSWGGGPHHLWSVSHQRLLLSTPAHQTQQCGRVFVCACVSLCVWEALNADGKFPLWPSSVLWARACSFIWSLAQPGSTFVTHHVDKDTGTRGGGCSCRWSALLWTLCSLNAFCLPQRIFIICRSVQF